MNVSNVINDKKYIGVVISFEVQRGFGFIRATNGKNYFTHIKDWMIDGDVAPTVNQRVRFELVPAAKGPKAVNVRVEELDAIEAGASALAGTEALRAGL